MKDNFRVSLKNVLRHEGGWSDDPHDNGGQTMKGVTMRTFEAHMGRKCTSSELRNISEKDLEVVYRKGYWLPINGDNLPTGVDYAIFDFSVNSGSSRALKVWRSVPLDGDIANEIIALCDKRLSFLQNLSSWKYFNVGWARRVAEVKRDALRMVGSAPKITGEIVKHEKRQSNATAGTVATSGGAVVAQTTFEPITSLPLYIGIPIGLAIAAFIGFLVFQAVRESKIIEGLKS